MCVSVSVCVCSPCKADDGLLKFREQVAWSVKGIWWWWWWRGGEAFALCPLPALSVPSQSRLARSRAIHHRNVIIGEFGRLQGGGGCCLLVHLLVDNFIHFL